jgi:hypothetical protein
LQLARIGVMGSIETMSSWVRSNGKSASLEALSSLDVVCVTKGRCSCRAFYFWTTITTLQSPDILILRFDGKNRPYSSIKLPCKALSDASSMNRAIRSHDHQESSSALSPGFFENS